MQNHEGTRKILLSGFPPIPPPLNGKSFCQKKLSGNGGYHPPSLMGESPKITLHKMVQKRTKISAFDQKFLLFSSFFSISKLGELPTPLDGKSFCPKKQDWQEGSEKVKIWPRMGLVYKPDAKILPPDRPLREWVSEVQEVKREKQDHLRMNDSTGLNNHLRSIDRLR